MTGADAEAGEVLIEVYKEHFGAHGVDASGGEVHVGGTEVLGI